MEPTESTSLCQNTSQVMPLLHTYNLHFTSGWEGNQHTARPYYEGIRQPFVAHNTAVLGVESSRAETHRIHLRLAKPNRIHNKIINKII